MGLSTKNLTEEVSSCVSKRLEDMKSYLFFRQWLKREQRCDDNDVGTVFIVMDIAAKVNIFLAFIVFGLFIYNLFPVTHYK